MATRFLVIEGEILRIFTRFERYTKSTEHPQSTRNTFVYRLSKASDFKRLRFWLFVAETKLRLQNFPR